MLQMKKNVKTEIKWKIKIRREKTNALINQCFGSGFFPRSGSGSAKNPDPWKKRPKTGVKV